MRFYNPIERRLFGRMRILVVGAVWRAIEQCNVPHELRVKIGHELRKSLDNVQPAGPGPEERSAAQ